MTLFRKLSCLVLITIYFLSYVDGNLPNKIRVAAIFDEDQDFKHQLAFEYGIKRINRQLKLFRGKKLVPEIVKVPKDNSFLAQKATCDVLKKGVVGIFGPQSDINANHIKSITDSMEVPFIDTRWNYEPSLELRASFYAVNLHPNVISLGNAFVDLILAYGWDSVTILYQDNHSISRLKRIFDQTSEVLFPSKFWMTIKQLVPSEKEGYRDVLRKVFKSESTNIILDCDREVLVEVLKQAQQIGMMSEEYNFVLTSLDAHTVDYEDFKHGGTNFTAFRLIDTTQIEIQSIVREIVTSELNRDSRITHEFTDSNGFLDTDTALIYDSVLLFALSLRELLGSIDVSAQVMNCDSDDYWQHGNSFVNYMKMIELSGLSGISKFDNDGLRSEFELDIVELQRTGMVTVGSWNSLDGLNFSRVKDEVISRNPTNIMANKTFIITLIENPPYTMLKEETRKLEGNDQYEGFAIDLITEIAKLLHFNITLKLVDDGNYGSQNEHGNWNGMMQEVLIGSENGGADFAVADLSITTSRASAVDFSIPWMNLGISIIFIKPRKAPPDLLSFLSPFTLEVWIYTGISYVFVSLIIYVMGRFTPYEWNNPYPCIEEPEELENQFTFLASFWFTIGSLLQQGSDVAPAATSTRIVAAMWFFFALIMGASYTANLAAFLTVETLDKPIESAEDLSKQEVIKYGVVSGGSTMNFFKTSKFEVYQRMWEFMSGPHKEDVFVSSNSEGIEKVIETDGKYAFMMESASIEYIVERVCSVTQIGGLLDNKGYGIAITPNTPYKKLLDSAILQLQEGGVLFKLKTKWWKRKRGGGACVNSGGGGAVAELGLPNVMGVFLVTFFGCFLAILTAFIELIYGAKQQAEEMGTSWSKEIKEELRFAFICHGTSKTVRKPFEDDGASSSGSSSIRSSKVSLENHKKGLKYKKAICGSITSGSSSSKRSTRKRSSSCSAINIAGYGRCMKSSDDQYSNNLKNSNPFEEDD